MGEETIRRVINVAYHKNFCNTIINEMKQRRYILFSMLQGKEGRLYSLHLYSFVLVFLLISPRKLITRENRQIRFS